LRVVAQRWSHPRALARHHRATGSTGLASRARVVADVAARCGGSGAVRAHVRAGDATRSDLAVQVARRGRRWSVRCRRQGHRSVEYVAGSYHADGVPGAVLQSTFGTGALSPYVSPEFQIPLGDHSSGGVAADVAAP